MRSGGGCTMQQALTPEAASIVKQAVALAKRRGHAQVTPLHVATTMLAAPTGHLRAACLRSHSHPLQCKALELCFNVALNRLPASSSGPVLGPQSHHHHSAPSISNALVAAFKRAQAHQRRGSIESQQQPILAVKIELEQLIVSILDDPSVSRVMREAGFSSTQVKTNVEQAVSTETFYQTSSNQKPKENESLHLGLSQSPPKTQIPEKITKKTPNNRSNPEDIDFIIENLMNRKMKKKSLVVVGECLLSVEAAVEGVMNRVARGDVPDELKQLKFITIPSFSFGHLSRQEVEKKLGELKSLVQSLVEKGVVLYLGDLKWITDYRDKYGGQGRSCYCPVEDMIMELGRFVCGFGEKGRFWIMGIASFQTYMRCRIGRFSLENLWSLQPVTIPADSLALSLIPDGETQTEESRSKRGGYEEKQQLTCCTDCSPKFENHPNSTYISTDSSSSSLPSWLRNVNGRPTSNDHQDSVPVGELCKRWKLICSSTQKQPESTERSLTFSSISPSSSTSCFSYDQQYPTFQVFGEPKQEWRDHRFLTTSMFNKTSEPSLKMYINSPKESLSSNPNSTPNSASSSDIMELDYIQRFKEYNAENLNILCNALENKVPWQKNVIPGIASTVLQCRSGMSRRKEREKCGGSGSEGKEETWLFFQGVDAKGKEKIARELARVVFGSNSSFVSIALSSFSSIRADSTEDLRNKRSRDESNCSYFERFAEAVSANPSRVFMVEDVEQADYCSQMGIKRAIERGRITNSNGTEVGLGDAVVILSCESFSSRSRACSPPVKQKSDGSEETKGVDLDLNISINDDSSDDQSIDDVGLLESVDRCIMFKTLEL